MMDREEFTLVSAAIKIQQEPRTFQLAAPVIRQHHSMVAGGLPVISYTTRPTPSTSFTMREDAMPSTLCGTGAYSHVIKSVVRTARRATV